MRNPFRLSYGVSDTRTAHWVRLDGDAGWGEGTIPPYYGIPESEMTACWDAAARREDPFPDDPRDVEAWIGGERPGPGRVPRLILPCTTVSPACAACRSGGFSMCPCPPALLTSYTIAIGAPQEMARLAPRGRPLPDYQGQARQR